MKTFPIVVFVFYHLFDANNSEPLRKHPIFKIAKDQISSYETQASISQSKTPTLIPSTFKTKLPTRKPSKTPVTKRPTTRPSKSPKSPSPTKKPTRVPTGSSNTSPIKLPSRVPTRTPSKPSLSSSPTKSPVSSPPSTVLSCAPFSNSGSCSFCACAKDGLIIANTFCSGIPILNFTSDGKLLSKTSSTKCSKLSYQISSTSQCKLYSVIESCSKGSSCSSSVEITLSGTSFTSSKTNLLMNNQKNYNKETTALSMTSSSPSSTNSNLTSTNFHSMEPDLIQTTTMIPTQMPTKLNTFIPSAHMVSFKCKQYIGSGSCTFCACPNQNIIISGLGCSGSQYLQLFDSTGALVVDDNNYWGTCSQLAYHIPSTKSCQIYTIMEGCHSSSCSGKTSVAIYTPPPSFKLNQSNISYHGGEVMTEPVKVYFIWYGDWSGAQGDGSNTAVQNILTTFVNNLSNSSWWRIVTTYTGVDGRSVSPVIYTAGSAIVKSTASITDATVNKVVQNVLKAGSLPMDRNAVYVVVPSQNISDPDNWSTTGCKSYCGYHQWFPYSSRTMKVAFITNPYFCPKRAGCLHPSYSTTSANGNPAADAMVSVVAHEVVEAVTNPAGQGWYDDKEGFNSNENADYCYWKFDPLLKGYKNANMILGGKPYLVQQNWVNRGAGKCALSIN